MAGPYQDWEMSNNIRADARQRLEASLYRDLPPGTDPATIESRVGRERLIAELSGTTDKRSRAWKTARDTLTRYRTGRRQVGPKNAARIRRVAERDRAQRARRGPVHVNISADFRTSGKRWPRAHPETSLTGPAAQQFLNAIEEGDSELALQIFMDEYGLDPDRVEEIEELREIAIYFEE